MTDESIFPLVYFQKQVMSQFPNNHFSSLDPAIVFFHLYDPTYSLITIDNQLPSMITFINYQWNTIVPDASYNFTITVSYINPNENKILPGQGNVQVQLLPNLSGEKMLPDKAKIENEHACRTLSIIFSICPKARVRLLYTPISKGNSIEKYKAIFNELKDFFYPENNFIYFTNVGFNSISPPPSNFQSLLMGITIPMFYAVGNSGWSINNFNTEKNTYDYIWFTSNFICNVGSPNHSKFKKKYYSSCGFLEPALIPLFSCPTPFPLPDPRANENLQSYFLRLCKYNKSYIEEFTRPFYQFVYQNNLPLNYQNQFRVPDVSDWGTYIFYNGNIYTGTSYSVVMFSMSYAVVRMISNERFIINPSSESNFLAQMYKLQHDGGILFQYDDSSKCQIVTLIDYPIVPININCRNYNGYISSIIDTNIIGLNVMGLGTPLWKNWQKKTDKYHE